MKRLLAVWFFVLVPAVWASDTDIDVIQPGDILTITVYRDRINVEQGLSGEFVVDSGGLIDYHALGKLPAAGRSPDEVADRLRKALGKTYMVNPRVEVKIKDSPSQTISVLGKIAKSGKYPLSPGLTLMGFVSHIEGLAPDADLGNIRISRIGHDGQRFSINASVDRIMSGEVLDIPLKAGDILFIGAVERAEMKLSSLSVSILGYVRTPGNYPVVPGLTLVRLISQAGGFTELAAPNKVRIVRQGANPDEPSKTYEVNVAKIIGGRDKDMALEAGDIVYVPETLF